MFKHIFVIFAVFALLAFVSCGKVPEEEIQKTNTAIQTARTAEAEEYAPDVFQMAVDTLNAAIAAKEEADSKFALFRSYNKSEELLARAEALANEAEATAQTEKERVKLEVEELITQAKAVLDSATVALGKAPRGKGTKADIELIKSDLASANTVYEEAKTNFAAGSYSAAKTKLEVVIQKAWGISKEIAKAAAKKAGR